MHRRGVVFGDLHPKTVLVSPSGEVSFIDFEASSDAAEQAIAAPGFKAPQGYTGTAVDRYALGCLRLAVFAPMTVVMTWGPEKAGQMTGFVEEHFRVGADFAGQVRDDLAPAPRTSGEALPAEPVWERLEPSD
ncbi:hypothetical protein ACFXPQ_11290 [Streptomyces lydicus]|uniref:hypothetical protein n=1 Tax=Streptomyces lydicus TaxID=47763 RepID=UPI0036B6B7FF